MKQTKQIIAEHKELKSLLSKFGYVLTAWDPGVSFYEKVPLDKDLLEANEKLVALYKKAKRPIPEHFMLKTKFKFVYHHFDGDQWSIVRSLMEDLIKCKKLAKLPIKFRS